ncbi:MAG: DUF1854 domain-containing protein [Clostridia bacterium]|nr:DUF1854 domain-containing protein [Clostridia bacterium]
MENSIIEAAKIHRLTAENASFGTKNGFLTMTSEDKTYDRVFLHRAFPFDKLWEFISVLDIDSNELGMILSTADFSGAQEELLKTELQRKYYSPMIRKIISVKDQFGFSYWKVMTDEGETSFTMQDTFRNIVHVSDTKKIFMDVDGNRFIIEDIHALDRKSLRKIELYL